MEITDEAALKSELSEINLFPKAGKELAEIFGRISNKYELINHLLTFGFDNYWRRQAARLAFNFKGSLCLDIATGTGDMARALARQINGQRKILAVDFCWPMITKLKKRKNSLSIIWPIMAQASYLPFKANSIDLITLAFATRNLFSSPENLLICLREFHRVLRPGGLFLNLETSQPAHPILRQIFHLYVRKVVKPIGHIISKDKAAYSYLSNSILQFIGPEELKALVLEAGFSQVTILPLTGGTVALHLAFK